MYLMPSYGLQIRMENVYTSVGCNRTCHCIAWSKKGGILAMLLFAKSKNCEILVIALLGGILVIVLLGVREVGSLSLYCLEQERWDPIINDGRIFLVTPRRFGLVSK